jgi:hypothetical protein
VARKACAETPGVAAETIVMRSFALVLCGAQAAPDA